jgi:hypothetical protein
LLNNLGINLRWWQWNSRMSFMWVYGDFVLF